MKIKNINLMLVFLLVIAYACKEENSDPEADFRAGTPIYKQDDNTYFKLENDSLFKYTASGKVFVEHTIDADMNLSSSELNVSGMISESMFPDQNQKLFCFLGYPVVFQVSGKADGIALYTGDSTNWGYSNKYEDYPMEVNAMSLDLNNENRSDEAPYDYWYTGNFTATIVATNFWFSDANPKELTKTITVEIVDPETVPFID